MAPTPQHLARKVSHCRSLLLALLCLVSAACYTTAQTGKIIFDDSRGTVSLQTISDRSIQVTHPINLEPALLAQLLKGMKIQDHDLGHNHVNGLMSMDAWPYYSSVPVFSEDEIRFLAPPLAEGLRTSAPDQYVEYHVQTTRKGSALESPTTETTAGSLYACGRHLYVILSQYRYNPMMTNMRVLDIFGRYLTLDYSGLQDRTLLFTPKAAQRVDRIDPPIRGKKSDRFLAIDYQLLQQASPPVATTEEPAPRMESVAEPIREPLPGTSASEAPCPTTKAR